METFIPYEKLSKKEKRRRNAERRNGWGALSPVTRRSENPRAYKRQKAQRSFDDDAVFFSANDLIMLLSLCKLISVNYITLIILRLLNYVHKIK